MEIWKDVVGYIGLYRVSSLGNFFSIKSNKSIKQTINIHGYLSINLTKNKIKKTHRSHRLIAIAFIPNPMNKSDVNHINGIKTDNRIENLEWNTRKENINHSWKNGLSKVSEVQKNKNRDNFSKKVINTVTGEEFNSLKEAAIKYNLKDNTLSRYLNGLRKNKTNLKYK